MSSGDHLGGVRKQLHPGHTSSASKLVSVTSGHYNQPLHLDDFPDSSRASKLLMRRVSEIAQKAQRFGAVRSWASLMAVPGVSMERGRDDPTQQLLPSATTSHPVCSSRAAHHFDFMLPMSHPVGGGLVYAGGELCLYSHINWKCIKPVSYPGLCTYFISASYSALSQPQYFVFLVWKLIKKKLDHHERLHFLKLAVVRKNSICFMSPQFQSVKSKFPSTQSIYFSSLFTLPVLHGIKLKCRKTFMGFLD